jgi:hypothetical protein
VRGKGSKLGEPCPKVRLSQDMLAIEPLALVESQVTGKGVSQVRWSTSPYVLVKLMTFLVQQ